MYSQELSQILIKYFDSKSTILDFSLSNALQSLGPWYLPYS